MLFLEFHKTAIKVLVGVSVSSEALLGKDPLLSSFRLQTAFLLQCSSRTESFSFLLAVGQRLSWLLTTSFSLGSSQHDSFLLQRQRRRESSHKVGIIIV
jgi:hypothetical protein